jgi:DNA-binding GntR family transcriptional regulator
MLEAQGLVEIGAHKGARVTAQTEAHITETYLMRMALESLAARLAMRLISDEHFDRLVTKVEELTDALEKCVAAGDSAGSRQVNFDIHMAIYAASEMPRLLAMIESLWATYPFGSLTSPPEERKRMVLRHREYLEVLRERDPEKLAHATEAHIRGAREGRIRDEALAHA